MEGEGESTYGVERVEEMGVRGCAGREREKEEAVRNSA